VDRLSVSSLFAARDLDELRSVVDEVADGGLTQADEASITAVLAAWNDVQAVANLLMYPMLIPEASRRDWLAQGLSAQEPYVRLAAAVGVGQIRAASWSEADIEMFVPALLRLVAQDDDVTASRAALSLAPLARPADAPELTVLLDHPDPGVRRNLEAALLRSVGPEGIAAILDAGFLDEDDTHAARQALAADGIDLDAPVDERRLLPSLAYIPNYSDWAD
jgi:HEAT repeat protein